VATGGWPTPVTPWLWGPGWPLWRSPAPSAARLSGEAFGLGEGALFAHWRDLLEAPRLGEAAIVALPDRLHAEAAIALMEKGYHLLLEKPIAPTWEEVLQVAEAKARTGRIVALAYVLRYTPYARRLKALLEEGAIGGGGLGPALGARGPLALRPQLRAGQLGEGGGV
jgi:hypothetical protein